jgi:hypothetical protein
MFKMLGADQKEYGPVSAEVLRQWIAEGRANAHTQVQPEGTAEWKPLSALPEFSAALAASYRPPTLPGAPPLGRPVPVAPAKTSGLAIASLVLGILGLCSMGLTGLIGLVLGIVALRKIDKSQGELGGKGLAIAGICTSGVFLLFLPIQAGLFLPALAKAKARAQTVNCVSNLKQVGLAIRMYANDNKETFPLATNWCDAIQVNLGSPRVFVCPAGRTEPRSSYAYNAKLSGLKEDKINPQTVMVFECNGGWNVTGGPGDMITRHRGTYTVCLADGSVQQVSAARLSQLRWDPSGK